MARDKSLMLGIVNTGCVVCWSVGSGLALNFGHLPAVAVDANSFIQKLAQVTPAMTVNRPILRIGSEGAAVSELQTALKLLGYYTDAVDGVYRESTAIAVSQFQKVAGINVDGITGPATWDRLLPNMPSAETPPPTSSNNPAVETPPPTSSNNPASAFPVPSSLQTTTSNSDRPATIAANSPPVANPQPTAVSLPILRLGMQGPAVAQLQERLRALGFLKASADGRFGSATQAAVQAAQQNFKLNPDGVVGPATWSALLR